MGEGGEKSFNFFQILLEGSIAGGTAGVVVETALYPIDTIKTRLQAARGGSRIEWKGLYYGLTGNLAGVLPLQGPLVVLLLPLSVSLQRWSNKECKPVNSSLRLMLFVSLLVKKGLKDCMLYVYSGILFGQQSFKGYGSFLLRDLPFDAIQFCIYEQLRIGYKLVARRELNDPENALIGAFSGAITGAITTPLDVMKTRLMVQGQGNQYTGIVSCAQTILREEGPKAFLKGIEPRVLWIGIGGSIFFGVLEKTKSMLAERRKRELPSVKDE